jgi:hypothetical protein
MRLLEGALDSVTAAMCKYWLTDSQAASSMSAFNCTVAVGT